MADEKDTLTPLARQTSDYVGAWNERQRTFNRLGDLRLSDDDRKKAIEEYKAASKTFEDHRTKLLK